MKAIENNTEIMNTAISQMLEVYASNKGILQKSTDNPSTFDSLSAVDTFTVSDTSLPQIPQDINTKISIPENDKNVSDIVEIDLSDIPLEDLGTSNAPVVTDDKFSAFDIIDDTIEDTISEELDFSDTEDTEEELPTDALERLKSLYSESEIAKSNIDLSDCYKSVLGSFDREPASLIDKFLIDVVNNSTGTEHQSDRHLYLGYTKKKHHNAKVYLPASDLSEIYNGVSQFGAKTSLMPQLNAVFDNINDKFNYDIFIDVCAGSATVGGNLSPSAKINIFNDLSYPAMITAQFLAKGSNNFLDVLPELAKETLGITKKFESWDLFKKYDVICKRIQEISDAHADGNNISDISGYVKELKDYFATGVTNSITEQNFVTNFTTLQNLLNDATLLYNLEHNINKAVSKFKSVIRKCSTESMRLVFKTLIAVQENSFFIREWHFNDRYNDFKKVKDEYDALCASAENAKGSAKALSLADKLRTFPKEARKMFQIKYILIPGEITRYLMSSELTIVATYILKGCVSVRGAGDSLDVNKYDKYIANCENVISAYNSSGISGLIKLLCRSRTFRFRRIAYFAEKLSKAANNYFVSMDAEQLIRDLVPLLVEKGYKVLLYVDPPYLNTQQCFKSRNMGLAEHKKLVEAIESVSDSNNVKTVISFNSEGYNDYTTKINYNSLWIGYYLSNISYASSGNGSFITNNASEDSTGDAPKDKEYIITNYRASIIKVQESDVLDSGASNIPIKPVWKSK